MLDLTYNNFRAAGASALAAYVSASAELTELSVRNNELGEDGCASVGQMLESKALTK